MPFAEGQSPPQTHWQLRDATGKHWPCRGESIRTWPDGSLRWLRVAGLWPGGTDALELLPAGEGGQQPVSPPPLPPWSPLLKGKHTLVLRRPDAREIPLESVFLAADGKPRKITYTQTAAAQDDFQRTLQVEGRVPGYPKLTLSLRIVTYAGSPLCRLETTLWNRGRAKHPGGIWDLGDAGSLFFRHLGWSFPGNAGGRAAIQVDALSALSPTTEQAVWIHQGSAGGENWKHPIHADKDGKATPRFRGYRLQNGDGAASGSGQKPDAWSGEGERAEPILVREDGQGVLGFYPEDFWQRFPGYLGCSQGRVQCSGFPEADGQTFELQGGEKARTVLWLALAENAEAALAALQGPRRRFQVLPDAACLRGRLGAWFPLHADWPKPLEDAAVEAVRGDRALSARCDHFQEYGWRHYGDLPADHEEQFYSDARPLVSHYNNQYDLILGMLGRYLADGDGSWADRAHALATHVYHHDLYHTAEDKAAYNGGYFWHTAHYLHAGRATHRAYSAWAKADGKPGAGFGGGPSNEHNYSTGFLLHHFLTGSETSRLAVLQLAQWVVAMQDGTKTPFRFLSANVTGLATRTRDEDFQGPGRGAGNSLCALMDAFILTQDNEWLAHADAIIRICIHPDDDREGMGLLNHEDRWSYTVFLQNLGRYLEICHEMGRRDGAVDLAHASLLAYARWMAAKEYPNLAKPETLEFPTSTWAFQDLRKACVFAWAARYGKAEEFALFETKADEYVAACFATVTDYPGADWIRNIALLFACSPVLAGLKNLGKAWNLAEPEPTGHFIRRIPLIPQKSDALRKAKRILSTGGLAGFPIVAEVLAAKRRRK